MIRRAVLVALGAVVLSLLGVNQGFCADVVGSVSDTQAHPVVNVKISVRNTAGQVVGQAQTDAEGHYQIAGLASGTYKYVLDAGTSGFKGGEAVAYLGPKGLTINWKLSPTGPAIALASEGTAIAMAGDPFGFSPLGFAGLVAGGVLVVAGGTIGGYAAAGGFSGSSASPAL